MNEVGIYYYSMYLPLNIQCIYVYITIYIYFFIQSFLLKSNEIIIYYSEWKAGGEYRTCLCKN